MLITLPIEVWLDILDWLIYHRREVALKFNELGDRQFNEITQKWLHEKTKNIEIGKLRVINPRSKLYIEGNEGFLLEIVATKDDRMQPTTASLFSYRTNLGIGYLVPAQFAEVPMPENITDFKKLTITFLDYNSLQFIRKMGSLFANIRLEITLRKVEKLEPTRDALMNHLLPLFIGIKTIVLMNFPQLLFAIRAQFPAKLSAITFINLLLHEGPITDELAAFIVGWLCEQRRAATNEVEEPRMFALNVWEPTSLQLIETIREQFLLSTTPISFFFCFFGHSLGQLDAVQDMTELNARTDEKFVIRKREVDGQLLIGRCPSKYKENWLLKMEHKMADEIYWSGKRKIELEVEAIGRMEATDLVVEEEVVIDQQEQPGPSSSKKRKLN